MDENDFWLSLEFRLCREFQGLCEGRYRNFWCDGFIPSDYMLDHPSPRITGRCWIGNGQWQNEWEFALLLPATFVSRATIDWPALLPPENVTRWMVFDEGRRYIEIEPADAALDLTD